jgi:hypothetical protein
LINAFAFRVQNEGSVQLTFTQFLTFTLLCVYGQNYEKGMVNLGSQPGALTVLGDHVKTSCVAKI